MTKSNTKTPVVFYVGLVLLCLFMFSLYLSGGMYARYATAASGSDGARVAKFDVTLTDVDKNWSQQVSLGELSPGESTEIQFNVKNNSEVQVQFKVTMTNQTGNLPLKLSNGANVFIQPVGMGKTEAITFKIVWPDTENSPTYAGKTDLLRFDFEVVQID